MKTLLFCYLAFAALLYCLAEADEMSEVTANVEYRDSKMKIAASVFLPTSPCGAFRLITDYDSLPKYIPGVIDTHHEYLKAGLVKVWQEGKVEIWLFHFKIKSLLEIHETQNQEVSFKQIEGSFASYKGEWQLQETLGGTRVSYTAELTFKRFIPVFLAKIVLENEVNKRFVAIAKEAQSRKNNGLLDCGVGK